MYVQNNMFIMRKKRTLQYYHAMNRTKTKTKITMNRKKKRNKSKELIFVASKLIHCLHRLLTISKYNRICAY